MWTFSFFGLPMYRLHTAPDPVQITTDPSSVEATTWEVVATGLSRQERVYHPQLSAVHTDSGVYYEAAQPDLEGGTNVRVGQPIQPVAGHVN